MKVMIVDDHALTREFIREVLNSFATQICECASGAEALACCAEFEPDLVTMDFHMEPMNGLETTRRLLARHPAACVVMVTQTEAPTLPASAELAGVYRLIQKDNILELRTVAKEQRHQRAARSQRNPPPPATSTLESDCC